MQIGDIVKHLVKHWNIYLLRPTASLKSNTIWSFIYKKWSMKYILKLVVYLQKLERPKRVHKVETIAFEYAKVLKLIFMIEENFLKLHCSNTSNESKCNPYKRFYLWFRIFSYIISRKRFRERERSKKA